MAELNLPEPIAAYFAADSRDAETVARCFTKNAVVKDEGRTHTGIPAITAWKTAATAEYRYTSKPLAVEVKADLYIVSCQLTGNFPGSRVDLRYAFRLERGKIAFLEIEP